MSVEKKVRNSKFELLRIIAMLFIIASHFSVEGNWIVNKNNFYYLYFFQPLGQIGVYCFVMISGYFLSSRQYRLKDMIPRINKLWLKIVLVSWTILCICLLTGISNINITTLVMAVFPVVFQQYWFITSFIVLMILVPILNLVIFTFPRKELFRYLIILTVITVIFPRIPGFNVWPLGSIFSSGIMITIYLVAGYIRKYDIRPRKFKLIGLMFISLFAEYASMYFIGTYVKIKASIYLTYGIFPFIVAICLFLLAAEWQDFYNKAINWIASSVLMAYLVTEHTLLREYLWTHILNFRSYQNNALIVFISGILVSFLVVILLAIIDKVYDRLVSIILTKAYSVLINRN